MKSCDVSFSALSYRFHLLKDMNKTFEGNTQQFKIFYEQNGLFNFIMHH